MNTPIHSPKVILAEMVTLLPLDLHQVVQMIIEFSADLLLQVTRSILIEESTVVETVEVESPSCFAIVVIVGNEVAVGLND